MRVIADAIAQAGEGLRKGRTAQEPDLGPGAAQTAGWVAAEAARTATTAWTGFLDRLVASTDGLAAQLRAAAGSYEGSDARADAALATRRAGTSSSATQSSAETITATVRCRLNAG
ncbi:hypothetical protein [Plantactinospora sp. CA-290183]|uniref:hypothetical protein n=1 Tax=Plantactinospora sp. CA-290183 TaxID=3240006 RepID=UPI003D8E12AC